MELGDDPCHVVRQLGPCIGEELWGTHRATNGKRGFSGDRGSRQKHFPTHLLAGSMVCTCCGGTTAQVSGRSGGYYGSLAATKGACENKTLVRRTLAEKVIVEPIKERISELSAAPSTAPWFRNATGVQRRRLRCGRGSCRSVITGLVGTATTGTLNCAACAIRPRL
jgi:hypothetical protein